MTFKPLLLPLVYFVLLSLLPQETIADDFYTAGVVEFHNSRASTTEEQLTENLKGYIDIITSDLAKDTDIIVFPESTLNSKAEYTKVPNPSVDVVAPCDDIKGIYHKFLVQLSCQARNVSKYIVINLSERDDCLTDGSDPRPCSSTGYNMFNTNVVFDRQGYVISRYRKDNLWGENGNNITYVPEYGYFDTEFGVRFGHFICFDILFYTPGQEMVNKMGITHFIYPAMWFSQLPFLTANQMHVAWSYGNDVALLAAGTSNPGFGNSGTGIYLGRKGPLTTFVQTTGSGVRRLFVGKVPKQIRNRQLEKHDIHVRRISETYFNQRDMQINKPQSRAETTNEILYLKRDPIEVYDTVAIDLSNGSSLELQLCSKTHFCCDFKLKWKHLNAPPNTHYYHYRLGVFDGLRIEVAPTTNELKNCAIFACLSDDIMDCGKYFEGTSGIDLSVISPQVAFERVEIGAHFPIAEHSVIMPNSLKSNILPVPVEQFEWHEQYLDSTRYIHYILNTTTDDLLTFSLYGNFYDTVRSGASLFMGSIFVLLSTTLVVHIA